MSRVRRLVLIKSVITEILVYWSALTWIPKGILLKIRRICSRFSWARPKEDSVLPWVAYEKVALPEELGGWGIKNI